MNVIQSLITFLKQIGNTTWEYQLYIAAGVLVLLLLISLLRSNRSYEVRLLKSVNKINRFFAKNPSITAENLVAFNNMMKTVPTTLRYCWQEYLLNRDKLPSEYMNAVECVERPSLMSSYKNATNHMKLLTVTASLLLFLLSFGAAAARSLATSEIFISAMAVPVLLLVFGFLFVTFMETRHTAIVADLYYSFHDFQRNVDKACRTLPDFIDYEILFTKKEIKQGLPVLQEYLEKMDMLEKQAKDEEGMNNLPFEKYDFEKLGVDNSLLVDRAMLESEKYINVKRNLSERIRAKEQEKDNYQKQFDEVTKDYEKKSQTSKENLRQLTEQMRATTVKIEANYLRANYDKEYARLQQLNKDYDMAKNNFTKEQDSLQAEIDKFNDEIAKRKAAAEEAMMSECETYVNKVYNKVTDVVIHQTEPIMKDLEDKQVELEGNVSNLEQQVDDATKRRDELNSKVSELETEYNTKLAEIQGLENVKEYFTSADFAEYVSGKSLEKNGITSKQNADMMAAMKAHENLLVENEQLKSKNDNLNIVNEKLESKSVDLSAQIDDLYATQDELKEENDRLQQQYDSLSKSLEETIEALAEGQEKLYAITAAQSSAKKSESTVNENVKAAYNQVDSLKKSLSKLKTSVDKVKESQKTPTITKNAKVNTRAKKEEASVVETKVAPKTTKKSPAKKPTKTQTTKK